jgi:hypothetical protein
MKALKSVLLAMAIIGAGVGTYLLMPIPAAECRDCYGCSCKVECWSNGTCKTVCRDSCGQFCSP